jgi:hypothetical protein
VAVSGGVGDLRIRSGIALFGISPFVDSTGIDFGLKPVMQFEARIIAVKPLTWLAISRRFGGGTGIEGRAWADAIP